MQHSETFDQAAAALAQAQAAFPTIPRDRKVTVKLKPKADGSPGGSYEFHYAPLSTILDCVRKPLGEAGLGLLQSIVLEDAGDGKMVEVLRTTLLHTSGQWFACDVPIFTGTGDNKSQAYASGVTYSRRYGVSLLLCISADEDDDGNGGDQSGNRPDAGTRQQGGERYQGSFPRGGGNKPRQQAQQQAQAPREPQRKAAPAPATNDGAVGDSEREASPLAGIPMYGDDLSPGQRSLLAAAAEAAGMTDEEVTVLAGGTITGETFHAVHRRLKDAVNARNG